MKKWKIGCIGAVSVVGLLLWGLSSLSVRAPRGGVVHIETPGGPVPLGITFFDRDLAIIDVGNGDRSTKDPLASGRKKDFLIRKFDWSSANFEVEFPRYQTVLVMEAIENEQGEYEAEGKLIVRDGETIIGELKAVMPPVSHQNWFGLPLAADTDEPFGDFGGVWIMETPRSRMTAMVGIMIGYKISDGSPVHDVNAVLLSFDTEHRNFAGRVTGNRIRLASFDNAYPALIDATIQDDGTLKGDLWVGDRLHESFTAYKK